MLDLNSIPVYSIEAFACLALAVVLIALSWLLGGHLGTKLTGGGPGQIRVTQMLLSVSWGLSFTCAVFLAQHHPLPSFGCVLMFSTSLGLSLGLALKEWDGKNPQLASSSVFTTTILCLGLVLGNAMAEALHAGDNPVSLQERFPLIIAIVMLAVSKITGLLVLCLFYVTVRASSSLNGATPGAKPR